MLANRFEKRLGDGYFVDAHSNLRNFEYGPEKNFEIEASNYGIKAEFIVKGSRIGEPGNFDSVLHVLNTAKKLFGDKVDEISVNDDGVVITIFADDIRKNEPRRDMLPKKSDGKSISKGSKVPNSWYEEEN